MTAFLALVRKDLKLYFRDRRSWIMGFAAPIAIATFLALALGGLGRDGPSKVTVAFVDEDHSAVTKSVEQKLASSDLLKVTSMGREEARNLVRTGKLSVAAVFPKDFGVNAGNSLFGGGEHRPELELLYDPSRLAERQVVEGVLTAKVMEAVSSDVFSLASASNIMDRGIRSLKADPTIAPKRRDTIIDLLEDLKFMQSNNPQGGSSGSGGFMNVPFTSKAEAVTARVGAQYNGVAHAFAGMGVQFILFMGIEGGVALLLQRQRGLWKRFRSAPVSKATLMGSRALSAAICALLTLSVMFLFARIVFGVKIEGSMAGFALVGVSFALMTAAFGILVASLGATPEGTRPIAVLATLLMVMLGGAWVPLFVFPQWLQTAAVVVPARWAMEGLDAMTWRGLGFQAAVYPSLVILGFTALFGAIAMWQFRWERD